MMTNRREGITFIHGWRTRDNVGQDISCIIYPLSHGHGKKVWYNMGRSHPSPISIDTSLVSVETEQQHHGTSDIGPKDWVQEGGGVQRLVWGRG